MAKEIDKEFCDVDLQYGYIALGPLTETERDTETETENRETENREKHRETDRERKDKNTQKQRHNQKQKQKKRANSSSLRLSLSPSSHSLSPFSITRILHRASQHFLSALTCVYTAHQAQTLVSQLWETETQLTQQQTVLSLLPILSL